ncbi:hypothetical protein IFR05_011996 [Cadophora sp. M221]|nr:hypothetical protein IFR05_011996 [Cadophora sp. M221]
MAYPYEAWATILERLSRSSRRGWIPRPGDAIIFQDERALKDWARDTFPCNPVERNDTIIEEMKECGILRLSKVITSMEATPRSGGAGEDASSWKWVLDYMVDDPGLTCVHYH